MDLLHAGKLFEMRLDILVGKTLNERSEYLTYTLDAKDFKRFYCQLSTALWQTKTKNRHPPNSKKVLQTNIINRWSVRGCLVVEEWVIEKSD